MDVVRCRRNGLANAPFPLLPDLGFVEGCCDSMKDVPLVSGMQQTREVVGEKELRELGKHCTSCYAVT